ncbi:MAG: hypothetical protein AB8B53_04500 [Flavobacteriales bacterium]
MKFLLSISLYLLSFLSIGQSTYDYVIHYANDTETTPLKDRRDSFILADDVLLRDGPGSDYKALESLSIGTPVKLLAKDTTTTTINGIKSNWYKAALPNETIGYIWGGLVAQNQFGSSQPGGVKFLLGLERLAVEEDMDNNVVFYTQIRAVKNGEELAKYSIKHNYTTFDLSGMESYGFGTTNLGMAGVTGVHDILRIHAPCRGGCGCSTGDVFIAWDGTEFHYMTEAWGTADAEYSEGEGIIFPNSMHGEEGFIIRAINRIIWDDTEDQTERKDMREEFLEYYIWNGTELQKTTRRTESIITEIENY